MKTPEEPQTSTTRQYVEAQALWPGQAIWNGELRCVVATVVQRKRGGFTWFDVTTTAGTKLSFRKNQLVELFV
jgi:hypothetical protein